MRFPLFGQQIDIQNGTGQLGSAQVTVLSATPPHVRLTINGPLPLGNASNLSMDLDCRDVNGLLVPTVAGNRSGYLTVSQPQAVQYPAAAAIIPADAETSGIAFRDTSGLAQTWWRNSAHAIPTLNSPQVWPELAFTFDVPNNRIVHRDYTNSQTKFTLEHKFLGSKKSITHVQDCPLHGVAFSRQGANVRLLPEHLLLHCDVLDKHVARDGNGFVMQHALVNGALDIDLAFADGIPKHRWRTLDPQRPAALLLLRWTDEHGLPLALVPQNQGGSLRLDYRRGSQREPVGNNPDLWQQTNLSTIAVPDDDDWRNPAHREPMRLRGLDAVSLLARKRPKSTRPFLLADGTAPFRSEIPMELYGIARGVRLQRKTSAPEAADCHLTVEPLTNNHNEDIFHQTNFILPNAKHWTLAAHSEEREVAPLNTSGGSDPKVQLRLADGKDATDLRLPAIDLAPAVANLFVKTAGSTAANPIPDCGVDWHARIDAQLAGAKATHFDAPQSAPTVHITGFRERPPPRQLFHSVLTPPRFQIANFSEARHDGPHLAAYDPSNAHALFDMAAAPAAAAVFTHGGTPCDDSHAQTLADSVQTELGKSFDRFVRNWIAPDSDDLIAAVQMLKDLLGLVRAKMGLADPDIINRRLALIAAAERRDVDKAGIEGETLSLLLREMSDDDWVDLWNEQEVGDFLLPLEWAVAPPTDGLFRRIAGLLHAGIGRDDDASRKIRDALGPHLNTLKTLLLPLWDTGGFGSVKDLYDHTVDGLFSKVQQGANALRKEAESQWQIAADSAMNDLRSRYGKALTADVYRSLLVPGAAADAGVFLEVLQRTIPNLRSLAELAFDPPDYVLISRRFPRAGGADDDAPVLQRFDLCKQGNGTAWFMLLDSEAVMVVKLRAGRTIKSILQEIHAAYASGSLPDPLGMERLAPSGDGNALDRYFSTITPEVGDSNWQGIFVVGPMADLGGDQVLRDLCGFEQIDVAWAAVGGKRVDSQLPLDVTARIIRVAGPDDQVDLPKATGETWDGDTRFSLVKFDVLIKGTRIEQAEIRFRLDLNNVWGRPQTSETIFITGLLPAGSADGATRALSFEARFEPAEDIDISVLLVKSLALRRVRAVPHNGHTSLDIDATIKLQNTPSLNVNINQAEIELSGLRIQLPQFNGGAGRSIGQALRLNIDFPSVRFAIPDPRAINLFGIEILPTGLGFLRDAQHEIDQLKGDFADLGGFGIPAVQLPDISVPHMNLRVNFGNLPFLGGLSQLEFDLVLGALSANGTLKNPFVGIRGLDAHDLHIDLFRIFTLDIKNLVLADDWKVGAKPASAEAAGGLLAKDVKFKLLGWSPLPETAAVSVQFLHSKTTTRIERSTLLAYADPGAAETKKFFRLSWALLTRNLLIDDRVLSTLLDAQDRGARDLVARLVDVPHHVVNADFGGDNWLLGLSFALGEVFKNCTLVLQDQHYYGIHLAADWLKPLLGQESLELAYIPGARRELDRFRTGFRLTALDMIADMRSGDCALEWGVNWDFLVDLGYPWLTPSGYDWFRAFSIPAEGTKGRSDSSLRSAPRLSSSRLRRTTKSPLRPVSESISDITSVSAIRPSGPAPASASSPSCREA